MKAILRQTKQTIQGCNRRYYELSEEITTGNSDWCGKVNVAEEVLHFIDTRIKSEYKDAAKDAAKSIKFVAVSDAWDHAERLVFIALKMFRDDEPYLMTNISIGGIHTSIFNMDYNSDGIKTDEELLCTLAKENGYKWEGIVEHF